MLKIVGYCRFEASKFNVEVKFQLASLLLVIECVSFILCNAIAAKFARMYLIPYYSTVCAILYKGISIILDMTWTGWDKLRSIADDRGIIYKRGDCSINPYVQTIDDLLIMKNATDVGLIFEDERGTWREDR